MYQGPVFVQGSQFLPESLIFCSRVSFLISGLHFLQGSQFSYLGLIFFMWVSFLIFSLHSSNSGLILLGDQPELSECMMTLLANCNIKYVKDGL